MLFLNNNMYVEGANNQAKYYYYNCDIYKYIFFIPYLSSGVCSY